MRQQGLGEIALRTLRNMRPGWRALFAIAFLLFVFSPASAQTPCTRYEVAHIIQHPFPCGGFEGGTIGTAISPNGRYVVGYYRQCVTSADHAFIFDTQSLQFTPLSHPAAISHSYAHAVSDAGLVVGELWGINGGGFIYNLHNDQYTLLVSGGSITAINASGKVCGTRTIGGPPTYPTTAFTWSAKNGFNDLGLINGQSTSGQDIDDSGTVCGWRGNSASSAVTRGFIWSTKGVIEVPAIPGGSSSACLTMNNIGQVGGHGLYPHPSQPGNVVHAFSFNSGEINDLGVLPGLLRSFALDTNDRQEIVGYCRTLLDGTDARRGYIWSGGIMRNLNELLSAQSGLSIQIAWAIDANGRIVAEASSGAGVVAVLLIPISGIGDITGDCRVNVNDLLMVINEWGKEKSPADLNGDAIVNVLDLLIVIKNWTMF